MTDDFDKKINEFNKKYQEKLDAERKAELERIAQLSPEQQRMYRIKLLHITWEAIAELLKPYDESFIRTFEGMPSDAKIIGVAVDPNHDGCFICRVMSSEFELSVPGYEVPPVLTIIVTKSDVKRLERNECGSKEHETPVTRVVNKQGG